MHGRILIRFFLLVRLQQLCHICKNWKKDVYPPPPPPPSGLNNILEEDNLISFMLTTEELEIVKSVVAALDPFKVATNFLCSRKFNLVSAEDIVRFTASKLEDNVDELSGRLFATERMQHWYHLSSSFKIQIPRARILITECQEEVT